MIAMWNDNSVILRNSSMSQLWANWIPRRSAALEKNAIFSQSSNDISGTLLCNGTFNPSAASLHTMKFFMDIFSSYIMWCPCSKERQWQHWSIFSKEENSSADNKTWLELKSKKWRRLEWTFSSLSLFFFCVHPSSFFQNVGDDDTKTCDIWNRKTLLIIRRHHGGERVKAENYFSLIWNLAVIRTEYLVDASLDYYAKFIGA